ncbi:hypothetical protein ACPOL_0256 [Acidisarcina polymorpha]|uniref:Uncharacterized protein n=1 Tax=Acidisarcina polymorpha TaxID=2211140 RepID=A0A2Z5FS80_9BACT|nr:hypothetical protein ACPOL_0256 [Acidisarcina polymorpha]
MQFFVPTHVGVREIKVASYRRNRSAGEKSSINFVAAAIGTNSAGSRHGVPRF